MEHNKVFVLTSNKASENKVIPGKTLRQRNCWVVLNLKQERKFVINKAWVVGVGGVHENFPHTILQSATWEVTSLPLTLDNKLPIVSPPFSEDGDAGNDDDGNSST